MRKAYRGKVCVSGLVIAIILSTSPLLPFDLLTAPHSLISSHRSREGLYPRSQPRQHC